MISRDIAVMDVHPDHWTNLIRGPLAKKPGQGAGWLMLIHHDNRVIHAVLGGKPRRDLLGQPVDDLAALRQRFRASRVVCIEKDFLRRTHTRFDSGLTYDMDYIEQLLTMIAAFRKERGSGLRMDPPSPPGPVPPFSLVQFIFNRLWPDNTSILLYVIDEDKETIWTSLILRKRRGDLDLLTTDLHLGPAGLDAGNWKSDMVRLREVASIRVAPPYLACFSSLRGWSRWLASPFRLDARRDDFVVQPFPRRLAVFSALFRLLARLRRA